MPANRHVLRWMVLPALLLGGCCGPSERVLASPRATMAVANGRAALVLGVVDYEYDSGGHHCGEGLVPRSVGLLLLDPSEGEVLGLHGLEPGILQAEHDPAFPPIVGVGQGGADETVVALGVPDGSLAPAPDEPDAPVGIHQVESGDGVTLLAWESGSAAGVTAWSPVEGVVWELPIRDACRRNHGLTVSPDRRRVALTRIRDCSGEHSRVTSVLDTADGTELTRDMPRPGASRAYSGVADDGRALVFLPDERQWVELLPDGSEGARSPEAFGNPLGAFAFGDRWLVLHRDAEARVIERDGSLTPTELPAVVDQAFVVAEEALWIVDSEQHWRGDPLPTDVHCVTRYGADLVAGESVCFDEAAVRAAYDTARR